MVTRWSRLAGRRSARRSPYWPDIVWRLALMASGMALTMAPATESIMGSLPLGKAGVGSAVNDTTRQVGGALGVAIIGSVLASIYGSQVGDFLQGKPVPSGTAPEAQAVARPRAARAGKQVPGLAATAIDGVHRRHARRCARRRRRRLRRRDHRVRVAAGPCQLRRARRAGAPDTARRGAGRHRSRRTRDGRRARGRARGRRGGRGAPARPPAQRRGRRGDPRGRGRALRRGRAREPHRRGCRRTRRRGQGHHLPPLPVQGRPRGGGRPLLHPGPGAPARHRLDARRPRASSSTA